jgi:hypothetical protein
MKKWSHISKCLHAFNQHEIDFEGLQFDRSTINKKYCELSPLFLLFVTEKSGLNWGRGVMHFFVT